MADAGLSQQNLGFTSPDFTPLHFASTAIH
jgi:hypothetical protein